MRYESEYRSRCAERGLDQEAVDRATATVRALEADALGEGLQLPDIPAELVERRVAAIVASGADASEAIAALARYFAVAKADRLAIRLLSYLLPIGVLETMSARAREAAGADAIAERILGRVAIPRPGSPPEAYVGPTKAFVEALAAELGPKGERSVLNCNVHGIPAQAFAPERARFLELGSVELWLADYHERQVETLRRHAADGSLWFEQRITPEVAEWVASRPDILGGVREGERILVTKIPYDPDGYLRQIDPLERRRLACHCPLARSGIGKAGAAVPAAWCHCSAGFEKVLFDAAFGQDTEVEPLETVLSGADSCKFSVRIPG